MLSRFSWKLPEHQLYEAALFVHLGMRWCTAAEVFKTHPDYLRAQIIRAGFDFGDIEQ